MDQSESGIIDVFPLRTTVFGLQSDWFEVYIPKLIQPSYTLMVLLLVVSVGAYTMKRWERVNWENKIWNIPVLITVVAIWPTIVLNLKLLIDTFNTFLINEVFEIEWRGFSFPNLESTFNIVDWSAEALARLLPVFAYWVLYTFFIIFFFIYAALGPLVLAKGLIYEEIDTIMEVIKAILNLYLWQTTMIIIVAFILPDIVNGRPFPHEPEANFYFLATLLGVMLFFIPSITRKFGNHFGGTLLPMGFRWGGAALGLAIVGRVGGTALTTSGIHLPQNKYFNQIRDRVLEVEEFRRRFSYRGQIENLDQEKRDLQIELERKQNDIIRLSQLARQLMEGGEVGGLGL